MSIQNTQPRSESSWIQDYTKAEADEIRNLVHLHRYTLRDAREMVAPKSRVKIRAPKTAEEIDQWFSKQRAVE